MSKTVIQTYACVDMSCRNVVEFTETFPRVRYCPKCGKQMKHCGQREVKK